MEKTYALIALVLFCHVAAAAENPKTCFAVDESDDDIEIEATSEGYSSPIQTYVQRLKDGEWVDVENNPDGKFRLLLSEVGKDKLRLVGKDKNGIEIYKRYIGRKNQPETTTTTQKPKTTTKKPTTTTEGFCQSTAKPMTLYNGKCYVLEMSSKLQVDAKTSCNDYQDVANGQLAIIAANDDEAQLLDELVDWAFGCALVGLEELVVEEGQEGKKNNNKNSHLGGNKNSESTEDTKEWHWLNSTDKSGDFEGYTNVKSSFKNQLNWGPGEPADETDTHKIADCACLEKGGGKIIGLRVAACAEGGGAKYFCEYALK